MNKEKAELWSSALRSGKFRQGKHVLEKEGRFCCLGVASFLAAEAGECTRVSNIFGSTEYGSIEYGSAREYSVLPSEVHTWLGLVQEFSGDVHFPIDIAGKVSAVIMNDEESRDFNYIADMIDEHWESL